MFGRLFFDNELTSFLQISSNNKISMIMLNGSQGAISEIGNFIIREDLIRRFEELGKPYLAYEEESVVKDTISFYKSLLED